MQAMVHAILLIVLVLAAAFSILVLRRRVPTSRQFVRAFAISTLGMCTAVGAGSHLCREGQPARQVIILGFCLLLMLTFVASLAWRRVMGTCLFVGMAGLSFQFSALVHTPGWTGNPGFEGIEAQVFRSMKANAVNFVADVGDVTWPEGWVRDLPVGNELQEIFEGTQLHRRHIRRVWHSPITGLYHYHRVPQAIWYPGGPFREGVKKLELRDATQP
jgi:hypothetical protein